VKIAHWIHEANADQGNAERADLLAMIASQDA